MTISSTTVKNSYSGDGSTTTFNYTFKIFADSDLQVIIRSSTGTETVKTITTHYTVTGAGSASGGSITFTAGNIPTATETVVLRRAVPQTQAIDYIANDPFPAESHEEGLDRAMMTLQQVQEEVTRSIKLSRTNTMTSTEFTVGASARANKILAFDTNGELAVTQELGTFVGNWSTATTFNARDLVKDTTNNNIYLCNTTHTSSGSLPISTNTDSAKWDLIVDSASATSSATAAASSATAAAASASAAATSESNAATSETNAGTSETNAASSASSASTSATNASNSATSASTSASNASTSETNASNSATAAASSATTAGTEATNASNSATAASTSATNAASSASAASTSASNAATSETNASNSASAASTSATNASNSATAAATAQAAAEAALDNFDDVYLGAKSSDPTVDNDGDPLNAGDLYFNTSSSNLKYYDGSAWVAITSGGITDLVQDGTPQLGGNLDVNGNSIVSVSNGNIAITPNGTGSVVIDGLSHPQADGSAGQFLKTDGSGNLSFDDPAFTLSYTKATATGDGSTTTLTIDSGRAVDDVLVYVNGFLLTPTTDYTISGTTLTFATAPASSAEIVVRYLPLNNSGIYTNDTATGDNSTTAFTIDSGRTVEDVIVTVNGVTLVPATDYTISGTTLTFTTAPTTSAEISIRYLRLN